MTTNTNDFQPLREQLETKRDELKNEIAAQLGGKSHVTNEERTVGDDGVTNTEQMIEISSMEHKEAELEQVLFALLQMDEGQYGCCTMCGADIAMPRLQAFPMATRCITCQTAAEKEAGAMGQIHRASM